MGELARTLMLLEDKKTQKAQFERQQKFEEEVKGPYMKALTRVQEAYADEATDVELKQLKRRAAALNLNEAQQKAMLGGFLINDLVSKWASGDPIERKEVSNYLLGVKAQEDLSDEISMLRLMDERNKTLISALGLELQTTKADREMSQAILGILLAPEAQPMLERIYGGRRQLEDERKGVFQRFAEPEAPSKGAESKIDQLLKEMRSFNEQNRLKAEAPAAIKEPPAPPGKQTFTPPGGTSAMSPQGIAIGVYNADGTITLNDTGLVELYRIAGGNPERAREIAKAQGYVIPPAEEKE